MEEINLLNGKELERTCKKNGREEIGTCIIWRKKLESYTNKEGKNEGACLRWFWWLNRQLKLLDSQFLTSKSLKIKNRREKIEGGRREVVLVEKERRR